MPSPERSDDRRTKLRIGMIGAGDISQFHLRAWQNEADAEVVAICDRVIARAAARAAAFAIPRVHDDATAMLAAERLDAVDIVTWRGAHAAMVRLAAAHGVHCLCQKPLAPSLAEAAALVSAVTGKIRLMVNENRRFSPQYRVIGDWLRAGRLGTIRQCHMTMHRAGFLPGPDGVRPAVRRSPEMGREPRLLIAETFIHQLDVLRFLLGEMELIAARSLHTEPDMAGETLATLMLETRGHAPVMLSGSFVAPGFGITISDRLELIGSRCSLILDGDVLELRGAETETRRFDVAGSYQICFDAAAAHFASCLRSGAAFETDAADNLRTLTLVEAAYASARRAT